MRERGTVERGHPCACLVAFDSPYPIFSCMTMTAQRVEQPEPYRAYGTCTVLRGAQRREKDPQLHAHAALRGSFVRIKILFSNTESKILIPWHDIFAWLMNEKQTDAVLKSNVLPLATVTFFCMATMTMMLMIL